MTSISKIAEMANVSKMTVSNVINKKYSKVSKKTRERIEKILEETNYTPNLFARTLKSNESKIIMLAIPQTMENDPYKNKAFNNPFYGELINSIEYNLRKSGYFFMFRFINGHEVLQKLIINWNIDGVIVLGAIKHEMDTIFKDIKVPSVFLDSYIDTDDKDVIVTDDEQGGFIATEHLIKSGRRKIGIVVSSLKDIGVASKRYYGYKKALKKYQLPFDSKKVFEGFPSLEFGNQIGQYIKEHKERFDALFVYSDIMALSMINGFKNHGIKVPEEVAVIGFDGLYIGELSEPKLTTVKQDITLKGEKAVNLLLSKLNGQSVSAEHHYLPVELVIRESV